MRIHVDLTSHLAGDPQILQVEKSPEVVESVGTAGEGTPLNGKYLIPVPVGKEFHVDAQSYVLDGGGELDGGDVTSIGFAHLLASFPQYGGIYFNPLLTEDNLGELEDDPTELVFVDRSVDPAVQHRVRFQTGRKAGSDAGNAPNMTAVLAANTAVSPNRPGLVVSKEIDISAYTQDCHGNVAGADQFMLYWKLYGFDTSEDVASDYGALAGTNEPAIKTAYEVDQEPVGFTAYISVDGGTTWCAVGLLEPVAFCQRSTSFRVAFRNDSSSKRYLAHFGVMF